jgi:hypothetical protein
MIVVQGLAFGLRRHSMKPTPPSIMMAQIAGNSFAAAHNAVHRNG